MDLNLMIGTGVVALIVIFFLMNSSGGSNAKAFSEDELEAKPASKKKTKKQPVAAEPTKKKKKKALKGPKTLASDLLDTPEEKKEEPKKSKSKKKGGGSTQPKPEPKMPTVSEPVQLSQQEEDDGWAVAMTGSKKTKKSKPKAKAQVQVQVQQAAARVAKNPDAADSVDVRIDSRKLGIIIGPGGATIKKIQETTGANVQLPDREKGEDMPDGPCTVTITGPAKGVQQAKKAIEDLAKKGYSSATEDANFTEGAISVPIMAVSELIGKRGVIIKTIQDTFEVRLNFPDTKDQDTGFGKQKKTVKVGIAGPKDKVATAKKAMKEILKYHHHPLTHPGVTHIELEVCPSLYSIVIGPRGSSIKHIQNSYDVKVHIPGEGASIQNILIVGASSDVATAKKFIEKMIEKATAEPEEEEYDPTQDETYDSRFDNEGPHEAWMDQYAPPPRKSGWNFE